jgi:hypothetical protein
LKSEIREVHRGKCLVCSFVKNKDVNLRPKGDTFEKHVGTTKAIQNMPHLGKKQGEWYVNKKCNHTKNEITYYNKNHLTIVEQVQGGVEGEHGKK